MASRVSIKTIIVDLRGPRIIATNRQAPRIYPRMIPLCSRFDSVLLTPKTSAIASYGNYSRSPMVMIRGQSRTISATAIFNTPRATPSCRQRDLKISGAVRLSRLTIVYAWRVGHGHRCRKPNEHCSRLGKPDQSRARLFPRGGPLSNR